MVVIDLFSGAGGLSEGFHENGFLIVAKVEKEFWACETLKTRIAYHYLKQKNDLNLYYKFLQQSSSWKSIVEDRQLFYKKYPELQEILSRTVLNKKFGDPNNEADATPTTDIIKLIESNLEFYGKNSVDVVIGGPPCQAYSLVGRGRMKDSAKDDPRNYLFYYYRDLVQYFRPKVFIFENVPGILNAKNGLVYQEIKEKFHDIGYNLFSGKNESDKKNVLDFKDFGIPQIRKRVILFGVRNDLNYQYPDFEQYSIKWKNELNALNILSDLPPLNPGEGSDSYLCCYDDNSNTNVELNDYQKKMRENSIGVLNHKARKIRDIDREIYRIALEKAEQGERLKYSDLPANLKTHKNEKGFLDRFKVHDKRYIPHTVVAHISKDGHYNIHPDITQARSLTVREAARIQTFPDNFKFEGPRTHQFVQVGNAVPPLMSGIMAKTLKEMLK